VVASISLFGSFQLYSASRNIAGRESVAVLSGLEDDSCGDLFIVFFFVLCLFGSFCSIGFYLPSLV
jgi:hypothetical protein